MTDTIIRQLKDRYPHAAFVTATQPLSAESFILQKEKQERLNAQGGAIGVIFSPDQNIFLTRRTQLHSGWALPGGTVEPDEDFADAFEREIAEELGIDIHDIEISQIEKKIFLSPNQEQLEFILCVFSARTHTSSLPGPTEDALKEGLIVDLFEHDRLPEEMIFSDREKIETILARKVS